jgi:biopolymer transport protein ExbB/TolQ
MNVLSVVASFFKEGGPFMFIILGMAVVITAIIAERMFVVGRAAAVNSRKMVDDVVRAAKRGDLAKAKTISTKSRAPVARIARAILEAGEGDGEKLQAAGDDAAAMALPPLTRRLQFLSTLANAATLLGLLGTIFGLTTAFSAVGAADPAQRSAFLAAGISQALNTTAFGLIVAVPTLLVHGWLVGLVEGIAEQVDEMCIRLSQAMARRNASAGAGQVLPMHSEPAASSQVTRAAQGGGTNWDQGSR